MSNECGYVGPLTPLGRNICGTPQNPKLSELTPTNHEDHNISSHIFNIHGDGKGLGHAKTYYNAAQNMLYSRYAPNEWEKSNLTKFGLSERERGTAERIRTDAWQSIKQVIFNANLDEFAPNNWECSATQKLCHIIFIESKARNTSLYSRQSTFS